MFFGNNVHNENKSKSLNQNENNKKLSIRNNE